MAEKSVERVRNVILGISIFGAAAVLVSLFILALGFHSNIQNAYNSIAPKVDNLEKEVWELRSLLPSIEGLNDENGKLGEQPKIPESDNPEVQQ